MTRNKTREKRQQTEADTMEHHTKQQVQQSTTQDSNNNKIAEEAKEDRSETVEISNQYPPEEAARLTKENILKEQMKDEKCKIIKETISAPTPTQPTANKRAAMIKKIYFIEDGLLMKRHNEQQNKPKEDMRDSTERRNRHLKHLHPKGRIVVPQTLRDDVLKMFHGIPLTGHLGRKKTTEMATRYFWWGGMSSAFRKKVRACHLCQMRKPPRPTHHMRPGSIQAQEPWEMVAIDTVGPLPESNGNVKILTCVDLFSRYPLAIPVPNEKAETVALALHKYLFSVHGYPKLILSDRAQGFVSKALRFLCKHLGIAKVFTTGLLPKGNANVERMHAGLNAALTMFCNRGKNDWTAQIDAVLFTFRISVNEATGYSPYFLIHGRHPRMPLEIAIGLHNQAMKHRGGDFVEHLTRAVQMAYRHVREQQMKTMTAIDFKSNAK